VIHRGADRARHATRRLAYLPTASGEVPQPLRDADRERGGSRPGLRAEWSAQEAETASEFMQPRAARIRPRAPWPAGRRPQSRQLRTRVGCADGGGATIVYRRRLDRIRALTTQTTREVGKAGLEEGIALRAVIPQEVCSCLRAAPARLTLPRDASDPSAPPRDVVCRAAHDLARRHETNSRARSARSRSTCRARWPAFPGGR